MPNVGLLWYLAAALLGLGIGRAANALADRVVDTEAAPQSARYCRTCGALLPGEGLLAVQTLVVGRRTCGQCKKPVSLRAPLVELALAIYLPLLLAHLRSPGFSTRMPLAGVFLLDALLIGVFAFTFAADLEHHLIFDLAIYPPVVVLVAAALVFNHKALAAMLFGSVLCGGLFLAFYGLGYLLYRQEALGFGDVTLAALVGMLVGWPGALTALVLTAVSAAAVSVLLLGLGAATRRTYIPFGTFLTLGAALALLSAAPFW